MSVLTQIFYMWKIYIICELFRATKLEKQFSCPVGGRRVLPVFEKLPVFDFPVLWCQGDRYPVPSVCLLQREQWFKSNAMVSHPEGQLRQDIIYLQLPRAWPSCCLIFQLGFCLVCKGGGQFPSRSPRWLIFVDSLVSWQCLWSQELGL